MDNAIWIFNPNDISYPPCKWNTHLAYYPGNEYVHMIGLTGYNTGDYFRNHTGERWRSFTEIYDRLWYMYRDVYSEFPWIITEFACSSVGGDKEALSLIHISKFGFFPYRSPLAIWYVSSTNFPF